MKTADLLTVIDVPAKKNLFLPSNLVDYVGAGRPILGIKPPGTPQKIMNKLEKLQEGREKFLSRSIEKFCP
jgi:hypothetical protein